MNTQEIDNEIELLVNWLDSTRAVELIVKERLRQLRVYKAIDQLPPRTMIIGNARQAGRKSGKGLEDL